MVVYRRKCAIWRSEKRPAGQTTESETEVKRSEGARLLQPSGLLVPTYGTVKPCCKRWNIIDQPSLSINSEWGGWAERERFWTSLAVRYIFPLLRPLSGIWSRDTNKSTFQNRTYFILFSTLKNWHPEWPSPVCSTLAWLLPSCHKFPSTAMNVGFSFMLEVSRAPENPSYCMSYVKGALLRISHLPSFPWE